MHGQTAFTAFLNQHFGGLANSILQAVHVQPKHADAPITNAFAMEILVLFILLAFFVLVRISLNVEKPNAVQQVAEIIHEFVSDQAESIIGHGSQRYVLFTTCVLLFVLLGNLLGMVPGLIAPTSNPTVPLGVALLTFLYYNFHGLREQGPIGYLKHFLGPIWWISWMMLPIEIISHLARILSLTVRLYANMFAGEMVTLVFFSLVPFAIPVIFMGLHLGVALIQAYIFMLLTMIYLAGAVAHEH
ncbi:MAG TPA: F0F1 ATP synthase subunit A [Acidobacteriaceae bacterium]|jgi:F-type H+-transporting ATPase subunit a